MLPLSPSFTSFILVGARRSLVSSWAKKTGVAILGSPLCIDFVSKLATLALIDIVLASFLTLAICETVNLLQFFLPPKICLPLNVGCIGTLEALIKFSVLLAFDLIVFFNLYSFSQILIWATEPCFDLFRRCYFCTL